MKAGALIPTLHLALVALTATVALADNEVVRWADVRGIIQPAAVVGTGTGAVTGGGTAWSTTGGFAIANVTDRGVIKFSVQGLVLAAGNSVGTRGRISMVKGTLVCDTNGSLTGNSAFGDTDLVPLDEQGIARFSGVFSGPLPAQCSEPDIAFLIRTSGGAWIAHGAVRRP